MRWLRFQLKHLQTHRCPTPDLPARYFLVAFQVPFSASACGASCPEGFRFFREESWGPRGAPAPPQRAAGGRAAVRSLDTAIGDPQPRPPHLYPLLLPRVLAFPLPAFGAETAPEPGGPGTRYHCGAGLAPDCRMRTGGADLGLRGPRAW